MTPSPLCPAEEIYGEHSEQTERLRYLRDTIMSSTHEGQELIRVYYEWTPLIGKALDADKEFKQELQSLIDGVLTLIIAEGE